MRERKKQRTRRALIEAAYQLFDDQGYEQTTVAAITAAADVAPATFYLHFPAKEDLLFADGQHLLNAGIAALAEHQSDEPPAIALVRAIRQMVATSGSGPHDLTSELEKTRLRLITSVPALQATTLHRVFTAQQQLAEALQRAYPGDIDALDAAALVGAVTGAILAASHAATASCRPLITAIERVLDMTARAGELVRDDK